MAERKWEVKARGGDMVLEFRIMMCLLRCGILERAQLHVRIRLVHNGSETPRQRQEVHGQ